MKAYQANYSARHGAYKKPFRKTKGCWILFLIIVIAAGFVYWSLHRPAATNTALPKFNDQLAQPSQTATLTYLEGTVESKSDSKQWTKIDVNAALQVNDSVRTDANSRAIIQLPDKSTMCLATNTEIQLASIGQADIVIEQKSGNVFHRVNDQSTAIYRVKNQNTELTALGTGFNVLASGDLTYVTVTDSRVQVKIYSGTNITNVRTLETGTLATINTTLSGDDSIKTKTVTVADLIDDEWMQWNLDQDKQNNSPLGIFGSAPTLNITEPAQTEFTTSSNNLTIKGQTDSDTSVFIKGKSISNDNGTFAAQIALAPGLNKIDILVQKGQDNNKRTLSITSTNSTTNSGQSTDLSGAINLSTTVKNSGVTLTWQWNGDVTTIEGFKTIISQNENPVYPGNSYHSVNVGESSDVWKSLVAGTYHFRVCLLQNNQCTKYSNDAVAVIK